MSDSFDWKLHPKGAGILEELLKRYAKEMPLVKEMERNLINRTSTRLMDWVDHMLVPWVWIDEDQLIDSGFQREDVRIGELDLVKLTNGNAIFFPLFLTEKEIGRLYLKVENIEDVAAVHGISDKIEGKRWAPRRKLMIADSGNLSLGAIERRGFDGYYIPELDDEEQYSSILQKLMNRDRWIDENEAFNDLEEILDEGLNIIGENRTADAFFYSERRYWETSNDAGWIQLKRQNSMGLGWGNHDHHTFRCSRENFTRTISILEKIGMSPRERFYAGDQAGWGAQVMEQSVCDIAVFTDVDLSPDEKNGDFAHDGLRWLESLGTVGLWVSLHGESILSAGLHHLAARVDFSRMMEDSKNAGIANMAPFSSFPYLKQCFTEGGYWNIVNDAHHKLLKKGLITGDQMERFEGVGARGSHLEFIERNEGFKGFNQEAVSDIINRTDPRR